MRKSTFIAALIAGLIAGTIDILSAFIFAYLRSGVNPERVLRYIASGAFGRSAWESGKSMMLAGLLFHYLVAISFSMFFFLIYPFMKWMHRHRWLTAIIYGLFAWSVMNLVVVPLSQAPAARFKWFNAGINMLILIYAIGIPLSFLASRHFLRRTIIKK
jgi:hypothetical protein